MSEQNSLLDVPEAFESIFKAASDPVYDGSGRLVSPGHKRKRYYVRYGGRAGAKSHQFALSVILKMYTQNTRVLCTRETMKSLGDSVHRLLCDKIDTLGLSRFFDITDNIIRVPHNGSSVIFKGLGTNINDSIKSLEKIDLVWVEEADSVTKNSWEVLIPTIVRNEGAEFYISFNTGCITDETYNRFVTNFDPERMDLRKVTYLDNPFLTQAVIDEAEALKKADLDAYLHIWAGEPVSSKDGGVFSPEKIAIIPAAPAGCRYVRGWDFASSALEPGKDPDFTAGVLLGYNPVTERYVVKDVIRFRGKPDEVERILVTTAQNDGVEVQQSIPTDPGQAGKFQAAYLVKKLAGYAVHTSLESGDKVTRAEPAASQSNVGNVDIVQAHWNDAFLNELRSFCGSPKLKDDQVDALSRAFARLATPRYLTKARVF